MECLAILAFLLLAIVVPFAKMLFGSGPNNWRKLIRFDLATIFLMVTGVGLALAVVRGVDPVSAVFALILVLPLSLAFVWLGRYVFEDMTARTERPGAKRDADLSFLARDQEPQGPAEELVQATVVADPPPD
jgi:hypothetical protein